MISISEKHIALSDESGKKLVHWDRREWLDDPDLVVDIVKAIRLLYTKGPKAVHKKLQDPKDTPVTGLSYEQIVDLYRNVLGNIPYLEDTAPLVKEVRHVLRCRSTQDAAKYLDKLEWGEPKVCARALRKAARALLRTTKGD